MDTDTMLEQLGSEATEDMVHAEFDGKTQTEILATINEMFPGESGNDDLAETVFSFCNS